LTDSITDASCNGSTNGSISVTIGGGVAPYNYAWNNGGTGYYINGLSSGSYSITVTDQNGCSVTASFTVGQPGMLTTSVTGVNATCYGETNGSASTTVTGGTGPYSYLWSNFRTTPGVSNLGAGTYFVIITDANGCGANDSVVITQPTPVTVTFHTTSVACFGSSTGSVSANANGGTPGYSFLWSTGATTSSITSLSAATYTLTVTDNNGCKTVDSVTINQPGILTATGNVTNVHCTNTQDGSIQLTATGGTAPYTYHWNNGDSSATIVGLAGGAYTVTITDANSCTVSLSFNVNTPTPIVSSVVSTSIACHGSNDGSATLTVSGGTPPYTFFWSNFQVTQNISGLSGGIYYVIITDSAGCTHRDSAIVTEPSQVFLTTTVTNITCFNSNNGAINLTVTGGNPIYTYAWSNGFTTQNISNLGGGTYVVTVTDGNGCTSTTSVVLGNPSSLLTNFVVHNDLCNGDNNGSIDLIQSGGTPNYTFVWNTTPADTTPDISGLAAGTYTVTVTDGSGCVNIDSATVLQPTPLYTSGVIKNVTCHGDSDGAIMVVAYGGTLPYSYLWSNGSSTPDIYQLGGGNYFVTVQDANGCIVSSLYVVHEPLPLTGVLTTTNVTCFGGSNGTAVESASGGSVPYQYLWNDFVTDPSRTGLSAGRYVVLLTDSNGCHLYDSTFITQPTQIQIDGAVTNASCYDAATGGVNISVSGGMPGYNYLWTTSATTQNISSVTYGTYTVTVTDASLCSVTDSFDITQPLQIFVSTLTDKPSCFSGSNGSVSAVAEQGIPPYTYQWSTTPVQTSTTASGLTAGSYVVTVTDAHGCSVTAVQVLTQPDSIAVNSNVTAAHCFNTASGEVIAAVSGGSGPYVYQLNGILQANDTFAGLLPGNYVVLVTDQNGCDGEGKFTVNAPGQISVSLTVTDQIILTGMKTQLVANATSDTTIINYFWSPLTLDSASVFDFSGCGDSLDCATPYIMPPFTNVFTVTVENADSCFASDTVTVIVNPNNVEFIPTAFTPNGDGLNDRFTFDILGASEVEVTIFDRWGERIYYNPAQTNGVGTAEAWDGTKGGKPLPEDTYVYQFRITYYNGKVESKAGTVTLMR
jgi:gliding motility-associated-like protein